MTLTFCFLSMFVEQDLIVALSSSEKRNCLVSHPGKLYLHFITFWLHLRVAFFVIIR